MAKGSAQGLWKGKKGSSVFYKIKNSNNAQKQGIRERVFEVLNQKSAAQAAQRMKMYPIQRLASELSEVITRGFEGVEYGPKSRMKFLSMALSQKSGIPAVVKDDLRVYPGKYIVSMGSLPTINIEYWFGEYQGQTSSPLYTNLNISNDESYNTIGELSADLLENTSFLQTGDQLTFVTCVRTLEDDPSIANFIWYIESIILDPDSHVELTGLLVNLAMMNDATLGMRLYDKNLAAVAATCILSRESDNGAHLRSTQRLVISSDYDFLFTQANYIKARQSYMKSSQINADWPTDPKE